MEAFLNCDLKFTDSFSLCHVSVGMSMEVQEPKGPDVSSYSKSGDKAKCDANCGHLKVNSSSSNRNKCS